MRLPNCHFASVFRSRQALSTKTSCSLFPSGDSFSLCRALIGPWLSLVERLVRDEEVASSNLAGPTKTARLRSDPARFELQFDCLARSADDGRSQICRARRRRDNLAGPTKTARLRSDPARFELQFDCLARSADDGARAVSVAAASPSPGALDGEDTVATNLALIRNAAIALNACSVGGETPIWRASWNVLMAGRLRISARW